MTDFADAPSPIAEYYRILTAGLDSYEEGRELLPLLDDQFDFEGPIAGRMAGAARFSQGVKGFIGTATAIHPIQLVVGDGTVATLYDADLPGGTVRFSEFFTIAGGAISELRIQYDPADYIAKGGR